LRRAISLNWTRTPSSRYTGTDHGLFPGGLKLCGSGRCSHRDPARCERRPDRLRPMSIRRDPPRFIRRTVTCVEDCEGEGITQHIGSRLKRDVMLRELTPLCRHPPGSTAESGSACCRATSGKPAFGVR
jgi:hypothetical protein